MNGVGDEHHEEHATEGLDSDVLRRNSVASPSLIILVCGCIGADKSCRLECIAVSCTDRLVCVATVLNLDINRDLGLAVILVVNKDVLYPKISVNSPKLQDEEEIATVFAH